MNTIFSLALLLSAPGFANEVYTNNAGCTVEAEYNEDGVMYYISQGEKSEIVGISKDLRIGTYFFCKESNMNVDVIQGNNSADVTLSCREHQNGLAVTKGEAKLEIEGGALKSVVTDGSIKRASGWENHTKINCSNLVKQEVFPE